MLGDGHDARLKFASDGGFRMQHPEILFLPVLMITDYLLTIASARSKATAYDRHFKQEQFELNPIWQKDVASLKWINPKHIALTILYSAAVSFALETGVIPAWLILLLESFFFSTYACIIGRHVSNLLLFRYVRNNPSSLSGEVTLTYGFVLALSAFQLLTVILPMLSIVALLRHPVAIGSFAGVGYLFCVHIYWFFRAKRLAKARQ